MISLLIAESAAPRPNKVWTSARRRAFHTAWPFVRLDYRVEEKPQMSEINVRSIGLFICSVHAAPSDAVFYLSPQPGVWDGLTSDEAREMYPDEWQRFLKDPYAHRAPRAESYHDLSGTLLPRASASHSI